jgi:3-oxoacyl-[acyl-carrier protein] reductase
LITLVEKTVLVSGGSRGIGKACCRLLSQAGAKIVTTYRIGSVASAEVVEEIRQAGGKAMALQADAADNKAMEEVFEAARRNFGPIDIAVACAGIWERAPIDEMSEEQWQRTLDVNLKSVFLLCRLAARQMKERKSGKIVLISSTAGQRGEAFYSHYAASKGAIQSLTKSLAAELGPFGINVNCVAPGWVETDMTAEIFRDADAREAILKSIPLGRLPKPEDIAGAVLFLASDLARHVQGEILNVNGGSVMCG